MEQTFKYLTHNQCDIEWGIYANVIGNAHIEPNEIYPPKGHPNEYNFTWKNGRILDEFQLIYITEGKGIFETKKQSYKVKEGDTILLFPQVWHRYKPLKEKGWTEFYIGFNGPFARQVIGFFDPDNPINHIGFNEDILQSIKTIIRLAEDEKIVYQYAIGGQIVYILGKIKHTLLNNSLANSSIEKIINKSRIYLRSHINRPLKIEELAKHLNISYSLFRSEFKKHTGVSPGQYLLQLKIQLAKDLLLNSELTIKELSFKSGFESPYYFSRVFKKHTGLSPTEFKHKMKLKPVDYTKEGW